MSTILKVWLLTVGYTATDMLEVSRISTRWTGHTHRARMALLVVLSLLLGIVIELYEKIRDHNVHIHVSAADGRYFADYMPLIAAMRAESGVRDANPYLQDKVALRSGVHLESVMLRGFGPAKPLDGIQLGNRQAKILETSVGAEVLLITPGGHPRPDGRITDAVNAMVTGVFDAGDYSCGYDLVYSSLPFAQAMLGAGDRISGIAITVDDVDQIVHLRSGVERTVEAIGRPDLVVHSWQDFEGGWLSALDLRKVGSFYALLCMLVFASFGLDGLTLSRTLDSAKGALLSRAGGCSNRALWWICTVDQLCIRLICGLFGFNAGIGLCAMLDLPAAAHVFNYLFLGSIAMLVFFALCSGTERIAAGRRARMQVRSGLPANLCGG